MNKKEQQIDLRATIIFLIVCFFLLLAGIILIYLLLFVSSDKDTLNVIKSSGIDMKIVNVGENFEEISINLTNSRNIRFEPEFIIRIYDEFNDTIFTQRKVPEEENLLYSIHPEYTVLSRLKLDTEKLYPNLFGDVIDYSVEVEVYDRESDTPILLSVDKKNISCINVIHIYSVNFPELCWIY